MESAAGGDCRFLFRLDQKVIGKAAAALSARIDQIGDLHDAVGFSARLPGVRIEPVPSRRLRSRRPWLDPIDLAIVNKSHSNYSFSIRDGLRLSLLKCVENTFPLHGDIAWVSRLRSCRWHFPRHYSAGGRCIGIRVWNSARWKRRFDSKLHLDRCPAVLPCLPGWAIRRTDRQPSIRPCPSRSPFPQSNNCPNVLPIPLPTDGLEENVSLAISLQGTISIAFFDEFFQYVRGCLGFFITACNCKFGQGRFGFGHGSGSAAGAHVFYEI